MRVLVVEDDVKIAAFVTTGLKQAGFAVDHVADGAAGLALALTEPYDAAVIDLMLPQLRSSLIEEVRRRQINTPMLILSAKRSVDDRVKGLQTGGDDYLTKPFAFAELLARVQGTHSPGERSDRTDPPEGRGSHVRPTYPGGDACGGAS